MTIFRFIYDFHYFTLRFLCFPLLAVAGFVDDIVVDVVFVAVAAAFVVIVFICSLGKKKLNKMSIR